MKKITELTKDDCQSIIEELFEDTDVKFEKIIDEGDEAKGFEYNLNHKTHSIYFNEPEILTKLYKKDFDVSEQLDKLIFDYYEMDEINNIFFEHITSVNEILNNDKISNDDKIKKIIRIRKMLAEKL